MSKQYENRMAKEMYRATHKHIRTFRCGFSGSNAMPQPDVLVTTADLDHALEIKGPIEQDHLYVKAEDIEQLVACETPWTAVYLAVKFQNREPVVVRYYGDVTDVDEWEDLTQVERFARLFPDCFDAYETDAAGNLHIGKPDTDDWPSARAGTEDNIALLDGIAVPHDDSAEIDELPA